MSTTKDKAYTVEQYDIGRKNPHYRIVGPTGDNNTSWSLLTMEIECHRLNAAFAAGQESLRADLTKSNADRDELVKALKRQRDAIHAINFYRANRNNPHAQKPLNSDVQEMWKELKESNNAAAVLLSRYPNP